MLNIACIAHKLIQHVDVLYLHGFGVNEPERGPIGTSVRI